MRLNVANAGSYLWGEKRRKPFAIQVEVGLSLLELIGRSEPVLASGL